MKLRTKLIAAAAWLVASLPAQATEYVMSVSADFSGPFANVMPNAMSGLKSITDWWNEEVGKRLGVSVKLSIHDMRYDAAVIARTWPAILRSEKPIMHLGFGSPDLTTLMKIKATLYLRKAVKMLGIAPFSSMFWFWVRFRFTWGSEKKTVALGSGSYWLSMKWRMLSSVPSLVTRSCRYLSSCCSTEVMLNSM